MCKFRATESDCAVQVIEKQSRVKRLVVMEEVTI